MLFKMEFLELFILCISTLFLIIIAYFIGRKIGEIKVIKEIPKLRSEAVKQSRAVLTGQFSEQLAPYLPDFPYSPTEARFIGKPVDFIVFRGMDNKEIGEVIFVEVKSGNSRLSKHQSNLKKAIQHKKVKWFEYRTKL